MKKTWIAGAAAALTLIAGFALAATDESRHVVVKLAGVGGEPGLSTFDLSELEIGESREIVAENGRTIVAQRDAAGYLLDLGDGKTMRLDGEDGVEIEGDGHRRIHVNKRVIRLGDGAGDGEQEIVRVFKSEDGEVTEVEGGQWLSEDVHERHPRVMIFKSDDGTVTQIGGDADVEWTSEDGSEHHVVKHIVRLGDGDGAGDEHVEMLLEALGDGPMDEAAIAALVEQLRAAHPCADGDTDCHAPKVIVVDKRVERTTTED